MEANLRGGQSRFFIGPSGLRSGWGILLFLALYLSLDALIGRVLDHVPAFRVVEPVPLSTGLVREAVELSLVLGATWAMSKVMRRDFLTYGYGLHHAWNRGWTGAAWGFVSVSVLIFCMWLSGHLVFDGVALKLGAAIYHALGWAIVFLMIGILEESLFRGFLQHTLSKGMGFWSATLLVSGAFILWHVHNAGESALGLLATGAGSLLFCLSLWYTRSLWWAIGFHTGWDWGQSFFYGTPDSGIRVQGFLLQQHPAGNPLWSGGAVGPEGSCFLFPLLCLLCIGMWFWWGKRNPEHARIEPYKLP